VTEAENLIANTREQLKPLYVARTTGKPLNPRHFVRGLEH
jgi:hypothetical protein